MTYDDAATALSHAFREAAAVEVVEEDEEDEVEVEIEVKAVEKPEDKKEETAEEEDKDSTEAYEQRLAEAIDALPDEEDLEVVVPPLELPPLDVAFFRPQEQDNLAYADAVKAYYEEKDYQRAIEKFQEAIANETQHVEGKCNRFQFDCGEGNVLASRSLRQTARHSASHCNF